MASGVPNRQKTSPIIPPIRMLVIATPARSGEHLRRNDSVVERDLSIGEFLSRLVALAGDNNDVALMCHTDPRFDRFSSIDQNLIRAVRRFCDNALDYLVHDRLGVL